MQSTLLIWSDGKPGEHWAHVRLATMTAGPCKYICQLICCIAHTPTGKYVSACDGTLPSCIHCQTVTHPLQGLSCLKLSLRRFAARAQRHGAQAATRGSRCCSKTSSAVLLQGKVPSGVLTLLLKLPEAELPSNLLARIGASLSLSSSCELRCWFSSDFVGEVVLPESDVALSFGRLLSQLLPSTGAICTLLVDSRLAARSGSPTSA